MKTLLAVLFLPTLMFAAATMPWIKFARGPGGSSGGGGGTEFVTGITSLASLVSVSEESGMKITVGGSPVTVSELGIYGNSGTHRGTVVLHVRSSGGTSLGTATVTWGTSAQWYWGTLGSPVVLSASTVYYIMTEDLNVDDVHGPATIVTSTAVATINDSAYGQPPSDQGFGAGRSTGPVSFKYTSP